MTPTFPPEWFPQSGVLLTWPHARSDWAPHLAEVEPVYVALAREIARREKVLIICLDEPHRRWVGERLADGGVATARCELRIAPTNDTWTRDYGPLTVLRDGRAELLDFTFNGWGGKFDADLDNAAVRRLHAAGVFGAAPLASFDLILEGGSIDTDGAGTLLTTARCLLAPTRNPALDRAEIERRLGESLGLNRFLWLTHGYLAGDDTDSHVDTLARFCDAHTIAYVRCNDPADEHYTELGAMEQELRTFRTADGAPYRLVPLPWPRARFDRDGQRLPATYANFLIINGAVLVPVYDDPADTLALAALAACFPQREVIGVPCLPLIYQHGSLHCVTMQLPAGVLM